jgi:hypothetical protein
MHSECGQAVWLHGEGRRIGIEWDGAGGCAKRVRNTNEMRGVIFTREVQKPGSYRYPDSEAMIVSLLSDSRRYMELIRDEHMVPAFQIG